MDIGKTILVILIGGFPLIIGIIINTFPPKKINMWYGFRTPGAMKNQDTWDEAQKYSAGFCINLGYVTLPCILAFYYFTANPTWIILVAFLYSVIIVVPTLYFTEKHLNKIFDKAGNRIS